MSCGNASKIWRSALSLILKIVGSPCCCTAQSTATMRNSNSSKNKNGKQDAEFFVTFGVIGCLITLIAIIIIELMT